MLHQLKISKISNQVLFSHCIMKMILFCKETTKLHPFNFINQCLLCILFDEMEQEEED